MEEVSASIVIDLVTPPGSPEPTLSTKKRLRRRGGGFEGFIEKRDRADKIAKVVDNYEFMQEDHQDGDPDLHLDDFVVDDTVNAGELLIREGIVADEDADLKEAFILLEAEKWREFLEMPVIKNKLASAILMLGQFGEGKNQRQVQKMWKLMWQGRLVVQKLERLRFNETCMACGLPSRTLTHVVIDRTVFSDEEIGFIGPDCMNIRLQPIINLVGYCREMPLFLEDEDIFKYMTEIGLQQMLDAVGQSSADMVETYGPGGLKEHYNHRE